MRTRRIAASTSAAVLALAALTACGGDDGGGQDNTKTEPKALAEQAIAEMDKFQFVSSKGTGATETGDPIAIDGCAVMKSKNVKMTMKLGDETGEALEVDKIRYMKLTGAGWAYMVGKPGNAKYTAAFEAASEGKFVRSEPEEGDRDSVDFFEGKTDNVTKGEVTTFQGKKVIPLVQERKEDDEQVKKTYFIAAKGAPVIVGQIEETIGTKEREETTFTEVDKCDVTAPPADQVVEEADFQQRLKESDGG